MTNIEISIIVPTKDRVEVFNRTLIALINSIKGLNAEIIVVNDSKEPVVGFENQINLTIVQNKKLGAASARNFGASLARGKILLFVDNDVLVSQANILQILRFYEHYKNACFNFYWIYPPDLIEKLPHSNFGRFLLCNLIFSNSSRLIKQITHHDGILSENGLASYFLSIEKTVFIEAGGYEEKIPEAGVEDMILSKRLKEMGVNMLLSLNDVVFHNEADRIELANVMAIYKRAALTRKIGSDLGHKELMVALSPGKIFIYKFFIPLKKILYRIAMIFPNSHWMDPVYFKLVKLLLGISTYDGFYNSKK